jgi:hypothetical protein
MPATEARLSSSQRQGAGAGRRTNWRKEKRAPQRSIKPTKRQHPAPVQDDGLSVGLDVDSEITRDEKHNDHYADDIKNIHLYSPRALTLEKSTHWRIERTTQRL